MHPFFCGPKIFPFWPNKKAFLLEEWKVANCKQMVCVWYVYLLRNIFELWCTAVGHSLFSQQRSRSVVIPAKPAWLRRMVVYEKWWSHFRMFIKNRVCCHGQGTCNGAASSSVGLCPMWRLRGAAAAFLWLAKLSQDDGIDGLSSDDHQLETIPSWSS